MGAEKVYAYVFAEAVPHYHELIVARYPGVPKEYWRLNIGAWPGAARGDGAAVERLAERLRDAMARNSGGTPKGAEAVTQGL